MSEDQIIGECSGCGCAVTAGDLYVGFKAIETMDEFGAPID